MTQPLRAVKTHKIFSSHSQSLFLVPVGTICLSQGNDLLCIVSSGELLLLLFYCLRVFHLSVSWWFSTEVWVTTSFLKSPALFSVFSSISTTLQFGQSSIRLVVSKSPSPCTNLLVTVPRAPIAIGMIVNFIFHSFSIPLKCRVTYSSFRILSILLWKFSLFLLIIRSGRLDEIRWSRLCVKIPESLCVSFSKTFWVVHILFVHMV